MNRELARRQHLSASDKAKQEKGRPKGRKFLEQLPEAFALKIEGVEEVSGKPAWVISGERKPGFRPKGSDAKILTKVRGKVWIDQTEYRWVKTEVEILDTISMELGLVRVQPGMHVAFEQTRVNDEVWLPSHFSIHGDARMGFLIKMHGDMDITYRDYKKFSTDSRIVSEGEESKWGSGVCPLPYGRGSVGLAPLWRGMFFSARFSAIEAVMMMAAERKMSWMPWTRAPFTLPSKV
jgi:hypothetical protein